MDFRQKALELWLSQQLPSFNCTLLPGDASFRRYFRVSTPTQHYIAMDAPPARESSCKSFIAIAKSLRQQGVQTPEIFASDSEQGFILLTDFGDDLFLRVLKETNVESLYSQALAVLATLQNCKIEDWQIPLFTADFMVQELGLCKEWFLQKYLGLTLTSQTEVMLTTFFKFLADTAANQPHVLMHRDFHSANLLALPNNEVGVLDFQDAFIGPVTYDLVSLLRDCYISWPDALVKKLVLKFKEENYTTVSDSDFVRWFDLMGMQRHLKALLTFSRKFLRDNNLNYLQHIPRTVNYLLMTAPQYIECADFHVFLQNSVLPAMQKVTVCTQ